MVVDDNTDPWGLHPSAHLRAHDDAAGTPNLQLAVIEDVQPLNGAMGVFVPETLRPLLFSDATDAPGCFALLDAAIVPNLADLLATSGLAYECLFRGPEDDDLRDVAPYLVALDPAASFTRHVFTQSNAAWDLWGRGAGVLLRSRKSLAKTCDHLRRFTKVATPPGTTLYLKFWHEAVLNAFLAQTPTDPMVLELLDGVEVVYLATTPLSGPQMRHLKAGPAA